MLKKAQLRLILWNVGVIVALLTAMVLALYFSISNTIEMDVNTDLTHSAKIILQATQYTSVPPTTGPLTPPGAGSSQATLPTKGDDDTNKDNHSEDSSIQTDDNLRVSLASAFYLIVDTSGKLVENPRMINDPLLPDRSVLALVLQGQSLFRNIRLVNNLPIRLYSVPVRNTSGQIVGMLQVGKEMVGYEEQLNQALIITLIVALAGLGLAVAAAFLLTNRALVPVHQSFERQRHFVADASHELRTPLALIRANAEVALLSNNKPDDATGKLLKDICQEVDYLTRLVADLLTLARADDGNYIHKPEPVELEHLAQEIVRQMLPLATARNLALKLERPAAGQGEIWLEGDPVRLRQLLLILLDNAIKYTQNGEVRLILEGEPNRSAVIKVIDTGIGIPQDNLDMIFDRFYRVAKARSRSEGGFGLGLSIARWIVQVHRGTIEVTSQSGKGSTFVVTLPITLLRNLKLD